MTAARNAGGSQRRPPVRFRAARIGLAGMIATLLASVAGALAAGDPAAVEGPGATRPGPPTAAEVHGWERAFLRSEGETKKALSAPAPARGTRTLFPQNRVVSLYGAAGGFGVIGRKSVNGAAKKLKRQAKPYARRSNIPVIKAFDLVAVIATSCESRRDKCRTRVSDEVIRRYLNKIRELNGRLILDIQPARSNVMNEIDHLRPFLRKPDVDVAIDAEWNVGRHGTPGQDQGSISAKKLNKASIELQSIIKNNNLSQKLMIVHQFHKGSIKHDGDVKRRDKVDVTFNFDGIGSRSAKKAGYRQLSTRRLFNGFSLFYKLDDNLMSPRGVMKLDPKPDYVMYQ
jgi:hypothetical protein